MLHQCLVLSSFHSILLWYVSYNVRPRYNFFQGEFNQTNNWNPLTQYPFWVNYLIPCPCQSCAPIFNAITFFIITLLQGLGYNDHPFYYATCQKINSKLQLSLDNYKIPFGDSPNHLQKKTLAHSCPKAPREMKFFRRSGTYQQYSFSLPYHDAFLSTSWHNHW